MTGPSPAGAGRHPAPEEDEEEEAEVGWQEKLFSQVGRRGVAGGLGGGGSGRPRREARVAVARPVTGSPRALPTVPAARGGPVPSMRQPAGPPWSGGTGRRYSGWRGPAGGRTVASSPTPITTDSPTGRRYQRLRSVTGAAVSGGAPRPAAEGTLASCWPCRTKPGALCAGERSGSAAQRSPGAPDPGGDLPASG